MNNTQSQTLFAEEQYENHNSPTSALEENSNYFLKCVENDRLPKPEINDHSLEMVEFSWFVSHNVRLVVLVDAYNNLHYYYLKNGRCSYGTEKLLESSFVPSKIKDLIKSIYE